MGKKLKMKNCNKKERQLTTKNGKRGFLGLLKQSTINLVELSVNIAMFLFLLTYSFLLVCLLMLLIA